MKILSLLLSALSALLMPHWAAASNFNFDYTYDGKNVTVNQSYAGNSIALGDVVNVTVHAAVGDFWRAGPQTYIFAPIYMEEEGERTGDFSWSFLRNGVVVAGGVSKADIAKLMHIGNGVYTQDATTFDTFAWRYTFLDSKALGNTFATWPTEGFYTLAPAQYIMAVPELNAYVMLLVGLGGLGGVRIRRKVHKK